MLLEALFHVLIILGCVLRTAAIPQMTTLLPFGVTGESDNVDEPSDDDLMSGVIIGSGADGTTYVLSVAPTATDDVGLTVTLVENGSTASAVVAISYEDIVATQFAGCAFSDSSAVCTQEVVQGSGSNTFSDAITKSGTADAFTVVISTSSANLGATGSIVVSEPTESSGVRRILIPGFLNAVPLIFAFISLA